LVDADLGDGVIKQRVARSGQGKSGGYRRTKTRAILVYGFAKSDKANLEPDELEVYRKLAKSYLAKSEKEMAAYVADGTLTEVMEDEEAD
jgi:hypothetical protein